MTIASGCSQYDIPSLKLKIMMMVVYLIGDPCDVEYPGSNLKEPTLWTDEN